MPLILVRLVPMKPTSGATFSSYLTNLEIKAFDLSFGDSTNGKLVGQAKGAWIPNPGIYDITQSIVPAFTPATQQIAQHYTNYLVTSSDYEVCLEAVATAIIELNPLPATEFTSIDLRLEIRQGGQLVAYERLDFNVNERPDASISNDSLTYITADPPAVVVMLPDPEATLDPNATFVELPSDGTPPKFVLLRDAINKVLDRDPGGVTLDNNRLTAAQSRQVAREIIWNRKISPPPERPNNRRLEDMYTHPQTDSSVSQDDRDKAEMDRKQYEANLLGYYALQNANSDRLAQYVFAASAAIWAEQESADPERIGFRFPVETGTPPTSGATFRQADVVIVNDGGLSLDFKVPAEYFYALSAVLSTNVTAEERYRMATNDNESRIVASIKAAIDANIIVMAATTPENAARRLVAIGRGRMQRPALCPLNADVNALVTAWLAEMGASIDAFWQQNPFPAALVAGHLDLVLSAVTQQTVATPTSTALIAAIKAIPVTTTAQMKAQTVQKWHAFFLNAGGPSTLALAMLVGDLTLTVAANEGVRFKQNTYLLIEAEGANTAEVVLVTAVAGDVLTITRAQAGTAASAHGAGAVIPGNVALLPDFTNPGTPEERVEAFVRQLRKYFEVLSVAPAPPVGAVANALSIPIADGDPFAAFLSAPGFAFPVANWPLIVNTLKTMFPNDPDAQAWLLNALQTIDELLSSTNGVGPPELQFSLLEALYARGFTSRKQIKALSTAEFEYALTGTVAYPHAANIYSLAKGSTSTFTPAAIGPFTPINPDGSLINCIPPWHLSPLGPVQYLRDLLATGKGATCEQPTVTEDTLGKLIEKRRGPLGDLHATAANVHTTLPLIDIVNENLEALVDNGTPGVAYDTNSTELGGHKLRPAHDEDGEGHAPNVLFAALPEHSTPATPVKMPGVYDTLAGNFSSPLLPYSQPLDISRSYLCAMGTSRFATMRAFREEITEFAIDAKKEAVDFQKHLWRYPVRIELAIEYLGLSPEEYQTLYLPSTTPHLHEMYGFPQDVVNDLEWQSIVKRVPEFLKRTGLDYCEFLELWKSNFVVFERLMTMVEDPCFPDCEPCCPEDLVIQFKDIASDEVALRQLIVFIRLWRSLKCLPSGGYSFTDLRDICQVLELFPDPASSAITNPDFIRQLAAFQVLRDEWSLDLGTKPVAGPYDTGAMRSRLLGLWTASLTSSFDWAVEHVLGRIEDRAEREHAPGRRPGSFRRHRPPEFIKILRDNLDVLSLLSGFDPNATPWNAAPTSTLRFTEILAKIYGSSFTTGELLYLFSVDQHLDGDDPFLQQDKNEALDQPFDFPEEGHPYDLWSLRKKLLDVHAIDEEVDNLTWIGLTTAMRTDFGYEPPAGTDPLGELGQHFFPETLAREGLLVGPQSRQYRTPLTNTTPSMWNFPHPGPFQYDANGDLVTSLPLRDEDVLFKLNSIEQLTYGEKMAVQQLYFAPRAELARFSFLFASIAAAEHALVEEADENKRWEYFRRAFVEFSRRAHIVAEHLAGHVGYASDNTAAETDLAWLILRRLVGDENNPDTAWEQDDGKPPDTFIWPQPTGGAFAALTRLTGTGLFGEVRTSRISWPELRGPMTVFSPVGNEWNVPVLTIVPNLQLPAKLKFAVLRNGLAIRESDGLPLAGAEGFTARWTGVLIVEKSGTYTFFAGEPTPDREAPDFEKCNRNKWRVNLRRGQKTYRLLNYRWADEPAPDCVSGPLQLKRGAYFIDIDFEEAPPEFDERQELVRARTGFTVKYQGPDTEDCIAVLPVERLYRDVSLGKLTAHEIVEGKNVADSAQEYLALQYSSSLRDIRRTYQRAFKALLFCHRLRLSSRLVTRANVTEIEYMLSSPDLFAGVAYVPDTPKFASHRAYLDFNFLPIGDTYNGDPEREPPASLDQRAAPTVQRRQALFDWFERFYDYTVMRRTVLKQAGRHVWLCFVEASNQQPVFPVPMLMDLGVDMDYAELVLKFHENLAVGWKMLSDDRWAVRVWHAASWVRRLLKAFVPLDLAQAQPNIWTASDATAMSNGNENLTKFYRDGLIERGEPLRYADIERLNNLLRERGRTALVAYLTAMNRIPLPFPKDSYATSAKDLSALLLIDVEAGICQKTSRIEEATTAVQSFVERARLSQEHNFAITSEFASTWDKIFATFRIWQACRRRKLYKENYIEWLEHERSIQTEAFRFLESELRRTTLTTPEPGGVEYWSGPYWPAHPAMISLQHRELSHLKQVPQHENLGLMGRPERHARPSWLAPSQGLAIEEKPKPMIDAEATNHDEDNSPSPAGSPQLPLWLQAAVRLGTRFLRIAAAGEPPAASTFMPHKDGVSICCKECGRVHPPVMDEYYFWLVNSEYYDPSVLNPDQSLYQDADWGVVQRTDASPSDMTSDWHRRDQLPQRLTWPTRPMVKLAWCRVHNGEFQTPRSTDDGAHVKPDGGEAQLEFLGREGDSLRFSITNADGKPDGYMDPSPWGFRYDIALDTAVVLPEVIAPAAPRKFPAGLPTYPFFVYFTPGAPLEPSVYSTAMTMAGALRANCRYEAALKWYELYFAPSDKDLRWVTCRSKQRPKSEYKLEIPEVEESETENMISYMYEGKDTTEESESPLAKRDDQDPCCDTLVETDLEFRARSVLLAYLETLLQYAQESLCRHTLEAYGIARLRLDTLAKFLGERPRTIFGQDDGMNSQTVTAFVPRFAPINPRLMEIYDRVSDQLDELHHCLTKARLRGGVLHRDTSYWGDNQVRRGWRKMAVSCLEDDACCSPPSPYRFPILIQRAIETAGEVRALGAELLAAFEKGDAEFLAAMRAGHERQLINLTEEIRRMEFREADWQVQALQKTKQAAQARRQFYSDLIANGLIPDEQSYQNQTETSMNTRASGNIVEAVGQVMNLIPDITIGAAGMASSPVNVNQLPLGTKLAHVFAAAARILYTVADITGTQAGLSLTEAGWDRREADWIFQVAVLDIEIQQIERQILAAERRRDSSLRQLNNLVQQKQQAAELQDFLRDKFTNHTLYLFLQQELAGLRHKMFEIAWCWARQAQRAFQFELALTTQTFLPPNVFDGLHEGLLTGERLSASLRAMEKAYFDQNRREYELVTRFSLRVDFPLAYLQLKLTGLCEMEIAEWRLDRHRPGDYNRRIKSVSLTIPSVVGPYTGVHCKLTLLSSAIRVEPTLLDVEDCCSRECTCGYCERLRYETIKEDPRIVKRYGAMEAIATSTGQNDTGLFEFGFHHERYLPFEHAGAAISRWRIELPFETNEWDIDSASDLIFQLSYTAREGGDLLRKASWAAASCMLPGAGLRFFDWRQDFADTWQRFKATFLVSEPSDHPRALTLRMSRSMFPYLPGQRPVRMRRVELWFEAQGCFSVRNHDIEFVPDRVCECKDENEECCERYFLTCVASEDWPCLFHGVMEYPFPFLKDERQVRIGDFLFPEDIGVVHRAYLICSYEAGPPERCLPKLHTYDSECKIVREGRLSNAVKKVS